MPLRPIPNPRTSRLGRVGHPPGKFTQSRRLDFLREQLETRTEGFTIADMAELLHVSRRSVRRYLKELDVITELEAVEVAPGAEKVWRIKPSERGRAVPLRRAQAYGLLAARRVYDVLKGSALFDEIELALAQVAQVAHRPSARTGVRGDAGPQMRLEDRFAYVPPVPRAYANRADDVDAVFQAVAETNVLRFRYREDGAEGKGARVTAHPYALVLHAGAIACIARDADRGATRAFQLDRMADVTVSDGERFELPPDFVLGDWLQGDFGVARVARSVRVIVEFDARSADAVRARRVHPSQKIASAPDGRVRASLTLPDAPDVRARLRSWLLGFGSAVRVVEPRELADDLAAELRRAASRYGG